MKRASKTTPMNCAASILHQKTAARHGAYTYDGGHGSMAGGTTLTWRGALRTV